MENRAKLPKAASPTEIEVRRREANAIEIHVNAPADLSIQPSAANVIVVRGLPRR